MKRSKINKVIKDMEELISTYRFAMPPFASWKPEEWAEKGEEFNEIRDNFLGWDITDFGMGDFDKIGLSLFTVRNGNLSKKDIYPKPYAEKLLMLYEGQTVPLHYHWHKMEDIINRGGNDVYIRVFNGDEEGNKLDTDIEVYCDGEKRRLSAGEEVLLKPGESLTLPPYLYHEFRVPITGGPALIGEVSMCNDDQNDNRFYESVGRFPEIEEDEAPYRLLCNEYPKS